MSLSIGIIGLPNVGKSTLFNALTRAQNAESANYPFCTIEPNKAVVPVPDKRLDQLAFLANSEKKINATVEFMDIAGLVKGASKGEGLGNKFLSNIKETNAILQVVRCFDDDQIVHVDGNIDPKRDIEIIETELIMADYQAVEQRIPKLIKLSRGDRSLEPAVDLFKHLLDHLGEGKMANQFNLRDNEVSKRIFYESQFLTNKPFIYCFNVDEKSLTKENNHINDVLEFISEKKSKYVKICAKLEEDLNIMDSNDRLEFLNEYGIKRNSLDQIILTGYETLGLISYLTQGPKESRAWTIKKGSLAPKAAGTIHSDFERGFIRAQVVSYNDFMKYKGEQGSRDAGVLRTEGRDYEVQDGDIIEFLFNV